MTTKTNHLRAGAFIVSEGNGNISRDAVTIDGSSAYAGLHLAGTVMGKLTVSGNWVPSPAGSTAGDGADTAKGVLFDDVDTTDGDMPGVVIARDAEVRASDLLYDDTVDTDNEKATKATSLAAVGIIVRA